MQENSTYRIRVNVGDETENVINVKLDQHYDSFEILSLKINQENFYKTYESDYGVVVGRVLANGGFGVPNAKVSIFIESSDTDDLETRIFYPYKSPNSKNADGIRYNLLTDFLDKACYQNVGTFPNKRLVLDNDDVIDVFDKYYRYTTVTNSAGDYMIFGVPTGSQRLHVDVDLSDIGMLSQRPRDMVYKGYDINLFESANKFKRDTNLNSLAQIKSQDIGIYVYPYWGDTSDGTDNIAVTRADIQLDYKFEPTCVFMGSIITDTGSNAIGKNCTSTEKVGKMSELISGEGSIEMIRKTYDGKIEEFQVKGNRVIDGDGVWCYQIPMNLDYIMTDEFGNIVPSDNPERGIPTRTRVRFRISLDDAPDDNTARKRCRYLVPNNPRLDKDRFPQFVKTKEPDYEFGTRTRDESFKDLLWNKVYTVKNYVPRLQKNKRVTDRKHTGIKLINHHEGNNPMPYNNVDIKLGFTYRLLCVIFKIFINLVQFLNQILTAISLAFCAIYKVFNEIANKLCFRIFGIKPLCWMAWPFRKLADLFKALIVPCVGISSDMCGGNTTHNNTFYPGCGNLIFSGKGAGALASCIKEKTRESHDKKEKKKIKDGEITESERTVALLGGTEELYNCVETALAEDNDTISLNFQNDWINGTLYAPMWFRKITKKRSYLFGLIKRSAKDQWCEGEKNYTRKILRAFSPCAPNRPGKVTYKNFDNEQITAHYMNFSDNKRYKDSCKDKCHESTRAVNLDKGLIVKRQTMLGQDVYYYKPVEYGKPSDSLIENSDDFAINESNDEGSVKILFATDIVLLGSLNDCDIHGVPQFFKSLEPTTFQIPPNLLFTDNEIIVTMSKGSTDSSNDNDPDNVKVEYEVTEESTSEMTGMDWGNFNEDVCGKWNDSQDSGLFYSIGCSTIKMKPKSCVNMSRICEFGVSLDETKAFPKGDDSVTVTGEDSPIDEVLYDTITPDGFISKDELYNDDERSLFATLNINGLYTERNNENGLMEYTFKHVVVNNFDKSLYEYMSERQRKCKTDKSQRFNYTLEEFSNGYYDFRMGKNPYFYDGKNEKGFRFPRYENSFYFYFGLNPGKTAIDKFNSQFTSDCANPNTTLDPIGIEAVGNSWCSEMNGEGDGYVAFNLSYIDLPCDIVITNTTDSTFPEIVIENNEDELFYISNEYINELEQRGYSRKIIDIMLANGSYDVVITDNNGEIIMTSFTMKPDPMSSYIVPTDFYEPDNVLMKKFGNDRSRIASNDTCLKCDNINMTRGIGGTIGILKPYNSRTNDNIEEYKIEVYHMADGQQDNNWSLLYSANHSENVIHLLCDENGKDFIIIGLPKGNETYRVIITELCNGAESNNTFIQDVLIKEKSQFKLYINGAVDYDVIKHWDCGFKVTDATIENDSEEGTVTFMQYGKICDKWWHMSNKDNYMWCYYQPYIDADSQLIDLSKIFKSTVNDLEKDINDNVFDNSDTTLLRRVLTIAKQACLYTYNINNKHFFYTEIEIKENDSDYECSSTNTYAQSESYAEKIINLSDTGANGVIFKLNELLDGIGDEDSEAYSIIMALLTTCEDAYEVLLSIDTMKDAFVNATKSAFQLTCSEYQIPIYFSVETRDRPVTYHSAYVREETDDETGLYMLSNGNELNDGSWTEYYTREGEYVEDIAIPTITYRDSQRFGHDTKYNVETGMQLPDALCLATDNSNVDNRNNPVGRLCNFIAVINGRGNTIPNDVCIKPPLTDKEKCGYSEHGFMDKVIACNYFGYHIIDKIFESPFMSWSYINHIPYFRPLSGAIIDENKAGVSMCMKGLFAGKIYNGNASSYDKVDNTNVYDTHFSTQLLGNKVVKIYTVMATGQGITTVEDMEDEMPTRRYIVGSSDDSGCYLHYRITDPNGNVHENTDNGDIWNNTDAHKQYVPVANKQMDFVLEDDNGCQIVNTIDGRMRISLQGSSVNISDEDKKDRKKGSKLNVKLENMGDAEDVIYMVFNVSRGREYPLNLSVLPEEQSEGDCVNTTFECHMEDGGGKDKLFGMDVRNLFSYYNSIKSVRYSVFPFANLDLAVSFGEQEVARDLSSKYVSDLDDTEIDTHGYSNTGEFTFDKFYSNDYENAYYVIALTDKNTRAISPVYDFCYLCSKLIFGVVYTKVETVNDEGYIDGYETLSSAKATYDIGNVVGNGLDTNAVQPDKIKYYFYYYPYHISFTWKVDEVNSISGAYQHPAYKNDPNGYVLFDIDDSTYDAIFKVYKNSKGRTGKFRDDATIEAVDVTGLRHVTQWVGCKRDGGNWEDGYLPCEDSDGIIKGCIAFEHKTWVVVKWVTNGGTWVKNQQCDKYVDVDCECNDTDDNGNCLYNTDYEYTKVYGPGDTYNPYDVGDLIKDGCNDPFAGWANSYDSMELVADTNITLQGKPEESMIYYAIWSCDFVTVTWEDCEGNVFATEEGVRIGTLLTNDDMPNSEIENTEFVGWYINYDEQASVHPEFNGTYEVTADTTFRAICGASCKPSLRLINCVDIGMDNIYIVHMTMTVFENAQAAESGTPLKTISIQWGPERMGSPDNPSVNNEDTYRHANAYSEGNVVRIEITAVELSNGCLIYPQDRCIEQLQGVDSDCRADITSAFCMSVGVIQPNDIVIGRACAGSQGKAVITQNGVDCSCTTMHRVVWKWGYDRNEDNLDNDVIKVDYYVCDHDDIMHPQGVTREGCTFNGWKLDGTDDVYDAWDVYTNVTSDLTFIAQWVCEDEPVVEPHTVTFVVGESTIGQPISVNDGEKVNISDIPEDSAVSALIPEGKVWVDNKWEWWSVVNGNFAPMGISYTRSEIASDVAITADTRFVAKLENVTPTTTYNVTFKVDTCQIGEVQEVEAGGHAVCPTSEDVEGSECFTEDFDVFENEWRLEGTNQTYSESYINDTYPINATTVFVAVLTSVEGCEYDFYWSVPSEVNNKDIDGNPITTDSLAHGIIPSGTVPTPPSVTAPTLSGFEYGGWMIRGGDGTAFDNSHIPAITTNVVFDGKWLNRIPWRLENHTNYVFYAGHVNLLVSVNGESVNGPSITFGGGVPAQTGVREGVSSVSDTLPSNWSSLVADVAVVECQDGNYTVTKTWTRLSGLLVSNTYTKQPNSVLLIKIYDQAPSYPVTFNAVDINGVLIREIWTRNVTVGTTLDSSIIPPDAQVCSMAAGSGNNGMYTLQEWSPDPYDNVTVTSSALVFNAILVKNKFNVFFKWDNDDPSNMITKVVEFGDYAVAPDSSLAPVKQGYVFSGWNPNPSETPIKSEGVTFIGVWTPVEPNTHTVTFVFGHDVPNSTMTVNDGNTVTPPESPTVEGYRFYSWDGDTTQPITSDVTFNAIWENEVVFKADGSIISTQYVLNNGHVSVPTVTVGSGKRFKDKWTKEGHSTQYSSDTVAGWDIQEPMVLVAVIVDVYTVEFYADSTKIGGTHTVESGNKVTSPDPSTIDSLITGTGKVRYEYDGGGWRIANANGTFNTYNQVYTNDWFSQNGITSNMKLFARLGYTVTFDFNQENVNDNFQLIEQGHHASVPQLPTVENCTFSEWESSVSGMDTSSSITDNVTFTAQWDCTQQMVKYEIPYCIVNGVGHEIESITVWIKVTTQTNATKICETSMGGGLISGTHCKNDFYSDAFPSGWKNIKYEKCEATISTIGHIVIDQWNVSHSAKIDSTGTYQLTSNTYNYDNTTIPSTDGVFNIYIDKIGS